jgi:hypothetical protein
MVGRRIAGHGQRKWPQGTEGDGLVQFNGTVSSISWTGANPEYWNGFNVGASAVPEPGFMLLLGTAQIGGAGAIRRKINL